MAEGPLHVAPRAPRAGASLGAPSSLSIAGLFFGFAFLLVFGEGEDGEVDRAIFAVLCEVGELGEVIRARMLHDDDAVALEEPRAKDHLREGSDLLQLVRWVGKDEVELRPSALRSLEVAEDIGLQDL